MDDNEKSKNWVLQAKVLRTENVFVGHMPKNLIKLTVKEKCCVRRKLPLSTS